MKQERLHDFKMCIAIITVLDNSFCASYIVGDQM